MKIVMIGESPSMATGFGGQTRLVCEGLAEQGHEIFLICESVPLPLIKWNHGVTELRLKDLLNTDLVDANVHMLAPDAVIVFGYTGFVAHQLGMRAAPRNCPVYYWLPYEGSSLPTRMSTEFRGAPDNLFMHLSKFASRLWEPIIKTPLVVPHMVDTDIWKYDPNFGAVERSELRRKYAKRFRYPLFDDMFIVYNSDRNIWHKRWDATYDYVRRLAKLMPDKDVVLLAHTKKIQTLQKGHPAGYDMLRLEKTYNLDGQVCYTDFDWSRQLQPSELVELMRLCDIRISTSSGEGFGIIAIEAAAIGKLQIVNNITTMPELLYVDNPMLVEPAMMEEKAESLWPIPNVDAMAQRTLELIDNPKMAQHGIDAARANVQDIYAKEKVIKNLDAVIKQVHENTTPEKLYYAYRWGYRHQHDSAQMFTDLAMTIDDILPQGSTVLEVGSFDGQFVKMCAEMGLGVSGMEEDEEALKNCVPRARPFIQPRPLLGEDWPKADVIVMTDMHDYFFETQGHDAVKHVYAQLIYYNWAFIRHRPRFTWGQPSFNAEVCRTWLEAQGMVRREDLEGVYRNKTKMFDHEIWCQTALEDFRPLSLEEANDGT